MTPEQQQRIAIAEACGWRRDERAWWEPHRQFTSGWKGHHDIPDYPNDLNAMHEAVETLRTMDGPQWWDFRLYLAEECGSSMNCIQATATQRAEAFLRTLNLWKP